MKLNVIRAEEEISVQVGDAFVGVSNRVYILVRANDRYEMRAIERSINWQNYDTLQEANHKIMKNINTGELKHYPQDHYEMEIKFTRK